MQYSKTTFFRTLIQSIFIPLILASSLVNASQDLLDVDDAFSLAPPTVQNKSIILEWRIAEDYHLYKDKMAITSSNTSLAAPILSKAKRVNDALFGQTDIYEQSARITVPFQPNALNPDAAINITVKYQGCADKIGVCYPPQTRTFKIAQPAFSTLNASGSNPSAQITQPAQSGFSALASLNNLFTQNSSQPKLLDADKAFQFRHQVNQKGQLELLWNIAHDYHLYQDKFKVRTLEGDIHYDALTLPKAEKIDDPLFGKTDVFHGQIIATLPIQSLQQKATLEFEFQGCSASAGVCYPPIKKTVVVNARDITLTTEQQTPTQVQIQTPTAVVNQPPLASGAQGVSESDHIANTLKNNTVWIVIATFFVFGLLLAFTPCVFPMIPILSSIIIGQGDQLTTKRAFTMSLVYVLAMSVTYTVAGILAGLFGENLQAAFQNPWIIGSFSAIFLLLSLSMFGFFELQLPGKLQSKLTNMSNNQQGGTLVGVAIMGFLSALIVGPCVAPPLAGALIYIGQTGDALLGGTALFAMSMGMGLPLLLLGTSAGKLLPRAGAWMDNVKAVFGVMLIGIAIWMLERIIPVEAAMIAWATLFIVSAIYMGAFEAIGDKSGWYKLIKGFALILFVYGFMILIGLMGGSKDMFQPLKAFKGGPSSGMVQSDHLDFKIIKNLADLEAELAKGQPIMLDFYADWCISCKEMEKLTFTDRNVHKALTGVTLLQADVTANDAIDKALMKHFGLIGPPAILFFTPKGIEQKAQRLVGFKDSEAFISNINNAFR